MADPTLRWIVLAEAVLLALSLLLGDFSARDLLGEPSRRSLAAIVGVAATLPLLLLAHWIQGSRIRLCRELWHFVEIQLNVWIQGASLPSLATVALLAGLAEEALFRGLLQSWLHAQLGASAALVGASLVFGLLHAVTLGYALFATLVGLHLGALWLWSGALLAPMLTHALYDFLILVYIRDLPRPFEPPA
ncbi:MAG: CPBP family intramembrane metalloprotease [Myxococcales bacterium]|nr:CPBP family intramembrane metalloprotease [Myxococcales bacterium]